MAKKNKPTPCPCPLCKRMPVVVKVKKNRWRVACPYLDCDPLIDAEGLTEDQAIEAWNAENEKEADQ